MTTKTFDVRKKLQCFTLLSLLALLCLSCSQTPLSSAQNQGAKRLLNAPIISPESDASLGQNIQGPSLIRVPAWVTNPLGKYYLYFADHKGAYIRLAYADTLTGPWRIHQPGTLQLSQTDFPQQPVSLSQPMLQRILDKYRQMGIDVDNFPYDPMVELTTPHIASPDVHVDENNQRIVMYFHGLKSAGKQVSRVAVSNDGLNFTAQPQDLGKTYMRVFEHDNAHYGIAGAGQFYRSKDGLRDFERGPRLFNVNMRHAGVFKQGDTLNVFWTQVGDIPERIYLSCIDLSLGWQQWQASKGKEILRPERNWEGADAPLVASFRSYALGHVNQLRDPYIFEEQGQIYMLYVVAGESGIAIAKLGSQAMCI